MGSTGDTDKVCKEGRFIKACLKTMVEGGRNIFYSYPYQLNLVYQTSSL